MDSWPGACLKMIGYEANLGSVYHLFLPNFPSSSHSTSNEARFASTDRFGFSIVKKVEAVTIDNLNVHFYDSNYFNSFIFES
jgi:hypothetical protein